MWHQTCMPNGACEPLTQTERGDAMTKKHFEALAAAIRQAREDVRLIDNPDGRAYARAVINQTATRISATCANFNPNFDRARFLAACGVEVTP